MGGAKSNIHQFTRDMTGKRQKIAAMQCVQLAFSYLFFFLRFWWRRPVHTISNCRVTFTIDFLVTEYEVFLFLAVIQTEHYI
jgi:hypothetical protein